MDVEYYKQIGFLCGLELHQRLNTSHKLFCSCNSKIENDKSIGNIFRFQRAVSGETGNIDKSAAFEEIKNRKFVYEMQSNHACLVDIDEEPPHEINGIALEYALAIANAVNLQIFNELQIMRKVIVDGSNPGAFQRTIMIGDNGILNIHNFSIGIPSIFLEEESSGIILSSDETISYDVSRVGIPLIEIDTDFHIPDPQAVKDVALYIGKILRISGFVQRGIGSIRQDVNVSIAGGARVEIKGFQDINNIDKFIENEILRQQNLLKIKKIINNADASISESIDITYIFKQVKAPIILSQINEKGIVVALSLKNFKGILGMEINPKRRFGTEVSDYAKIGGVNGIIHSDEDLEKYGFSENEIASIKKELNLKENDSFIIITGQKRNCENAIKFIKQRLIYSFQGVPEETRGVFNADLFTTKFLRPVPGSSRMYPETDLKPIYLTNDLLEKCKKIAPNIEKEQNMLKQQLKNKDLREQIILSLRYPLYKLILSTLNIDPEIVANMLLQKFTELKRNGYAVEKISDQKIIEIFQLYAESKITKQGIEELLKEVSKTDLSINDIIAARSLLKLTRQEIEVIIKQIMHDINTKDKAKIIPAIMSKYKQNIDGNDLNEVLNEMLKEQ